MNHNYRICFIVAVSIFAIVFTANDAHARRYGRRSYSYGSSGIKSVAPTMDAGAQGLRPLSVFYSYDKAMEEEVAYSDRIRVFLLVKDQEILHAAEPVVAEVKLTDLSNQSESKVLFCPVSFESTSTDYKLGVFDITNDPGDETLVEPAKVYRLFVNLHRKSEAYDKETVFGQVLTPYYVATSDESRLGRARQHIVMRTFKEYYYAEKGWASQENYPMDCYAYYMWATGSVTVGAQNGHTILGRLFGALRPFHQGSSISTIARREAIHGDYVRMSGHSFMLLAYDQNAGHVWTMEGNFNSTIKVVIRSIDSGWSVGHLVDEHVDPRLFQVSRTAAVAPTNAAPSL